MRKQTKIAAVVSAAALLAIGASMTSFAATGWVEENGTWTFYNRRGEQVTDTWAKSGNNWFYLNDNGEMAVDSLIESNDDLYYVDENGAMVTNRWVAIDNEEAGEDKNQPNSWWYFFGANGKAYKTPAGRVSLKTINGKRYTFDENAHMLFGWVDVSGEMKNADDDGWQQGLYYFGDENDGALTVGWKEIAIVDDNASADQPGEEFWDQDQVRWFYFKSSGKKQGKSTGATINGAKYAFDEHGRMIADWYIDASDSNPSKVKFGTSAGASLTGKQGVASYSGGFRYFSSPEDGARKTKGWFKVVAGEYLNIGDFEDGNDAWYYADGNGKIVANKIKSIGGKKYAFDEYGKMVSGLKFITFKPGSRTDILKIDGAGDTVGDFDKKAVETLTNSDYASYYFGSGDDGSMKTGNQTITIDDESLKFNFKTGGATKGQGLNGETGNKLYQAGKLVTASSDDKVVVALVDGKKVVTVDNLNTLLGTVAKNSDKETIHNVIAAPTGAKYVLVNTSGNIVKSGTKKDGNDYKVVVKDGKVVQIAVPK